MASTPIKPPVFREIRVPAGWEGQNRQLVIQLNDQLREIVRVLTEVVKRLNA